MPKTLDIKKLHPIDSFGIQEVSLSGIRVDKLEDRIRPGVPFPHKHDFFQILVITKGVGSHRIDFQNYDVSPGQLYLMKPGQMHSWELRKGIQGYIIEFSYQSLNELKDGRRPIHDFTFSPDLFAVSKKKDFEDIVKLADMMWTESAQKLEMQDMSLQSYLTVFLIRIIRLYQTHVNKDKQLSTIDKFRDLLEKNFKEKHSVEFYAKELKTSAKALTMQLSRSIGKPPRQLIQERILLEAKRYLAFSELSVAEIGYELGFEDANYFTRFFKVHDKKTPAKFRNEVKH